MFPTATSALVMILLLSVAAASEENTDNVGSQTSAYKDALGESSSSSRNQDKALHGQFINPHSSSTDAHNIHPSDEGVSNPKSTLSSSVSSSSFYNDRNSGDPAKTQQGSNRADRRFQGERHSHQEGHHVSRRSFDSINTSGLRGMNQNFLGASSPNPADRYPFGNSRRSSSFSQGKRASFDRLLDDESYSFLKPRDMHALEGDRDDQLAESFGRETSEHDGFEKRGFDSISPWNGGVSGISQNFIGPKRGEFGPFRRTFGQSMDRLFGMRKRDSALNMNSRKRNFDSISNGLTYGFHQNHLAKKDERDSVHHWLPGGFTDTFILKRALQRLGLDTDALDDDDTSVYSPVHQSKRFFDSIDQGELSGIHQNHLGKRQFDSISTGSTFSNLGQNFINKRSFDSINRGAASMYQNYLSKRDLEIDPAVSKRFDSINSGGFIGMNQNFVDRRSPDLGLLSEEGDLSPDSLDLLGRTPNQHFVFRRSVSSEDRNKPGQRNKRHFDSIAHSGFGGMHQNFVSKKSSKYASRLRDVLREFPKKRTFDSVGFNGLGGMNQNFIGKRFLDSIGGGRIGGLNQNFIDKRPFDHINDADALGGHSGRYISKKNFDSIGNSQFSGLGQNFYSKRFFDSIGNSGLGGMKQNFISKRGFDSLNSSPIGGFRQNFVGKRNFDSISSHGLHGMGQNFISKRLRYLSSKNPTRQHPDTLFSMADLMAKAADDNQERNQGTGDDTGPQNTNETLDQDTAGDLVDSSGRPEDGDHVNEEMETREGDDSGTKIPTGNEDR